jgi:hypothetical protein
MNISVQEKMIIKVRRSAARGAGLLILLGAISAPSARAANGTAYYFDINGTNAGFGLPNSTYANGSAYWNSSSAGTVAPVAQPAGAQLTFGNTSADFIGNTFTVNFSTGTRWSGLLINSTNANVTFIGTANAYLGNAGSGVNDQTWTVAAGSIFTMAISWNGYGLNI